MTENNTPETAITVAELPDLTLAEYGSRDDVAALARRIRSMLPGGDQLSLAQAMAAAQYAILLDANIYRGEIYAWVDKRGHLVLDDGYKLLVRWAKGRCNYHDTYAPLDDLPEGDIGFTCHILRDDARPFLQQLLDAGADFHTAFDIAAHTAVGIVRRSEMWSSKYDKPIDPPVGWTWEQVARKRALKNALNLSHGAPSPREIAAANWLVGDTATIPSDWAECTPEMLPIERERLAALTAHHRQRQEQPDDRSPDDILAQNRVLLRGDSDEDADL
jgi:hypothetical protein